MLGKLNCYQRRAKKSSNREKEQQQKKTNGHKYNVYSALFLSMLSATIKQANKHIKHKNKFILSFAKTI